MEPADITPTPCPHCGKPAALCVCDSVTPVENRVELVVLQHPQEQDRTLGSARLAVHALTRATFKVGLSWPSLSRMLGRDADPARWAVLYLGSANAEKLAPGKDVVILNRKGETIVIDNPQKVPDAGNIEEFRQPIVRVNFVLPSGEIGPIMQLCNDKRGVYVKTEYLSPTRAMLVYDLPLAEVIYDMHDKLKSITKGYGTMDYELVGYVPADLVRMDILVGGNRVDALSVICDKRDADRRGRAIVKKLRGEIDRHQFEVAIQAALGSRIIARETISALRKNVTAKCYGGDITRKRKLLAKQKEGKKRMKSIGSVDIPQKAFLAVLETGGGEDSKPGG